MQKRNILTEQQILKKKKIEFNCKERIKMRMIKRKK